MRADQEKVALFQEKYGFPVRQRPTNLSPEEIEFRYRVMREELEEWYAAAKAGDLVKVADGLADLDYTVKGTAVFHGIDLAPIFDEVHRSNMTKGAPVNGKPTKGAGFEPPRIAELLVIQSTGLNDALEFDVSGVEITGP